MICGVFRQTSSRHLENVPKLSVQLFGKERAGVRSELIDDDSKLPGGPAL